MTLYNQLNDALIPHGFILRGGFRLKNEEREKLGADNETLVLIGNAGPAFLDTSLPKGLTAPIRWMPGHARSYRVSPIFSA